LRWPERLRYNEETILDIPVEVVNNRVSGEDIASDSSNSGKIDYAGGRRTNLAVTGSRET